MLNISSSTPSGRGDFKLGDKSFSERVIYWTIVLTPLWWLLGVQTLLYPAIAVVLLAVSFDLDKVIRGSLPACVWAWLTMAVVMFWTATLGLASVAFGLKEIGATAVTFFKSYFLIFACLALPFWDRVRVSVVTRAVAWMCAGYLVSVAVEMAMLVLRIGNNGFLPPLARLIPGDKMSLKVTLADIQPFFRIPLPRTVLYTPDPPILGVCAVLCFFICLGETDRRLRKFALAGCLVVLVISFSRLAWICFPLVLLIMVGFGSRSVRQGSLWGASFTTLLCALLGLTVSDLLSRSVQFFSSARAESSTDRDLVVRKTLEAWQESPWLGWGIMRGTVRWYVYEITLGSFSTYASVLYLHGIIGFIFFIAALALTLWSFWLGAVNGNPLHRRAVCSLVALYVLCNATPLSWMAVYFWFFFVWLGAILAQTHRKPVSTWRELYESTEQETKSDYW